VVAYEFISEFLGICIGFFVLEFIDDPVLSIVECPLIFKVIFALNEFILLWSLEMAGFLICRVLVLAKFATRSFSIAGGASEMASKSRIGLLLSPSEYQRDADPESWATLSAALPLLSLLALMLSDIKPTPPAIPRIPIPIRPPLLRSRS
jgi:hypothetical protein